MDFHRPFHRSVLPSIAYAIAYAVGCSVVFPRCCSRVCSIPPHPYGVGSAALGLEGPRRSLAIRKVGKRRAGRPQLVRWCDNARTPEAPGSDRRQSVAFPSERTAWRVMPASITVTGRSARRSNSLPGAPHRDNGVSWQLEWHRRNIHPLKSDENARLFASSGLKPRQKPRCSGSQQGFSCVACHIPGFFIGRNGALAGDEAQAKRRICSIHGDRSLERPGRVGVAAEPGPSRHIRRSACYTRPSLNFGGGCLKIRAAISENLRVRCCRSASGQCCAKTTEMRRCQKDLNRSRYGSNQSFASGCSARPIRTADRWQV